MDHTMNQANADGQDGLFTTETAGLPEVASPGVLRLRDGDRLDLRIGPVRKLCVPRIASTTLTSRVALPAVQP
jgi:hypothetical protein